MTGAHGTTRRWAPRVVVGLGGVLLFFGYAVRSYMAELFTPPEGDVPCPRCLTATRGPSGWCETCTDLLRANPAPAHHLAHRWIAADEARDVRAQSACVAEPSTMQLPWGDHAELSRREYRFNVRLSLALYGRRRVSDHLGVFVDPSDPAFVWVHSRERAAGLPGLGDVDGELITRLHFDADHLIDEIAPYPALPAGNAHAR